MYEAEKIPARREQREPRQQKTMSDTNHIAPRPNVSDSDHKALKAAKRLEERRIKDGWRYVQATPMIQVFVPCDKSGKPTKDGIRRINTIINR